jgi:hypothetical protein
MENLSLIAVFPIAYHWPLSWATLIHSTPSNTVVVKCACSAPGGSGHPQQFVGM